MGRHLLGLIAGILIAPLLWAGTAWPAAEFETRVAEGSLNHPMLLSAAAVIMAMGLVCGVLAGTRVSPLAALTPGLAMLALALWPLVAPVTMDGALPAWMGTDSMFHPVGPALPMNLALGAVLIVSAGAPSRWRRQLPEEDPLPQEPVNPGPPPPPPPLNTPLPTADAPTGESAEKTTVPFRRG